MKNCKLVLYTLKNDLNYDGCNFVLAVVVWGLKWAVF